MIASHNLEQQITINRPELHNAFRPRTVLEMSRALAHAQDDTAIGVIVMMGEVRKRLLAGPGVCLLGTRRVLGVSRALC